MACVAPTSQLSGRRIRVRGLVQGVGFRPAVWRLAQQQGLAGHVRNDSHGVLIHLWGKPRQLDIFIDALRQQCPPLAQIDGIETEDFFTPLSGEFQIVASGTASAHTCVVPDAASCPACVADTRDHHNRRYRYPFTNCTHCGPRLSIIRAIPYDRSNTSMADFPLCPDCLAEYENPANRRFHAQPNACPQCGPKAWLEPAVEPDTETDTIEVASHLLQQGKILAIKGIGGFHLACDATHHKAVTRLRERKYRDTKPFALMARDIDSLRSYCTVSPHEEALLQSSAAPIVLLTCHSNHGLSPQIAPGQTTLGFMLPYTPLHHLLMADIDHPVVMTSGNLSNWPQCIDNDDALSRLEGLADYWLLHDRDIRNRLDDSVARVVNHQPRILRRSRGYAPAPLALPPGFEQAPDLLAFGAELKNTFCLIKDGQAILSQHMGDLENRHTFEDYEKNLRLYQQLFEHQPKALVIDQHPEYLSSKQGRQQSESSGLALIEVQHHHAHIAACLAENQWPLSGGKVLGIALDGLGYGAAGELWGGEFLLADYTGFQRLARFKPIALPGATQAMREPWRNTYAHLQAALSPEEWQHHHALPLIDFLNHKPRQTLDAMLRKGINSPKASSCGRLFDAVAAALDICRETASYEGQAAIELEALVTDTLLSREQSQGYPFSITRQDGNLPELDPRLLWQALLDDLHTATSPEVIATRFHLGLASGITDMVEHLCPALDRGTPVALSGGVFQNRTLFQLVEQRLISAGFQVLSHRHIPANDGGLALGQATIAAAQWIHSRTPPRSSPEKSTCV